HNPHPHISYFPFYFITNFSSKQSPPLRSATNIEEQRKKNTKLGDQEEGLVLFITASRSCG
ncbi:unnamed protein product, partial [Urochloa humidicola]